MDKPKCQMTVGEYDIVGRIEAGKCGRPAKYRNPKPEMGIELICGIHAKSLDAMYRRTGQQLRCIPLTKASKEAVKYG